MEVRRKFAVAAGLEMLYTTPGQKTGGDQKGNCTRRKNTTWPTKQNVQDKIYQAISSFPPSEAAP